MNMDQLEEKWDEIKEQVKAKWGKFTNEDIKLIHGKKDKLIGKLRERYNYSPDQANKELGVFIKDCSCTGKTPSAVRSSSAM